jgi:hypothetical protein
MVGRMERLRFCAVGALLGVAWAASLRGFMMQLAGLDSRVTFSGTFGVILPTGLIIARSWAGPSTSAGQAPRTRG